MDNLLNRFASTENGIHYLEESHWLTSAVQSWKYNASAGRKYVQDAEGALAAALCEYRSKSTDLCKINPIPVIIRVENPLKPSYYCHEFVYIFELYFIYLFFLTKFDLC